MAAFKWAKKQKNLSHTQKSVLICIADFLNDEKGFAWPSQKTIASETSLHRETVHRACIELHKKGLISWTKSKKENGTFSSNKYVINHVAECNNPSNGCIVMRFGGKDLLNRNISYILFIVFHWKTIFSGLLVAIISAPW